MTTVNELWASGEPPSRGDRLLIASGEAGVRQIGGLPTDVPGRGLQRRNWTRERFCAVALIRHLASSHPHLFPLAVERVDAPEFVFTPPRPAIPVAVEITDAGEPDYQAWLDRAAACPGIYHVPDPSKVASEDDAHEQAFSAALEQAIVRKLGAKFWRHAADLPRWLVLYDNTNTGPDVSDADAEACLRDQTQRRRKDGLSALVLVRSVKRSVEIMMLVECG